MGGESGESIEDRSAFNGRTVSSEPLQCKMRRVQMRRILMKSLGSKVKCILERAVRISEVNNLLFLSVWRVHISALPGSQQCVKCVLTFHVIDDTMDRLSGGCPRCWWE
jgi:hypothetical protein